MSNLEQHWNVIVNYKGGEVIAARLLSSLKGIESFACTGGLPRTAIRALLQLLVSQPIISQAKSNPKFVNDCVDRIVKCLIPNEPIEEEELDILVFFLRWSCEHSQLQCSTTLIAAWMYTALINGVVSKEELSLNYYVPLIVLLQSCLVQDKYLIMILTHIVVILSTPKVINKTTANLVAELYNSENTGFIKKYFAIIVKEYQKYNFLADISFGRMQVPQDKLVMADMDDLFKHAPKVMEEAKVEVFFSGLPAPDYPEFSGLKQQLLTLVTVEEMISAFKSNMLVAPKNPLSALATLPGQMYLVLMPGNSPIIKQLLFDAKAALVDCSANLSTAQALAHLQGIAKYPFPPLSTYWYHKVKLWDGNLQSDSGKLIKMCTPYLHFKTIADVEKMLEPLLCVFINSSLTNKVAILKMLESLHVNMVTLIAERKEPIPFTGHRPNWASDCRPMIEALAVEEEKFITQMFSTHRGDVAHIMTLKFYLQVADAEEMNSIALTLPSRKTIIDWVSSSNFFIINEACLLLNRYPSLIKQLEIRGTLEEFYEQVESLQSLTKDAYQYILWKTCEGSVLQEILGKNHELLKKQIPLRYHPALFIVLDELMKKDNITEQEMTEKKVLELMEQFAPDMTKFLNCWSSMDW